MKNNVPNSGTTWQENAAPSLVKDDEAGTTKRVRPADDANESQDTPKSNWPY